MNKIVEVLNVDGKEYNADQIRELEEALNYNRETLLMFHEALKDIKLPSSEINSKEGVADAK